MATTRKKKPSPKPPSDKAAEEKFNRDLLIRGEAAPLDSSGKLPLDATHEIVETKTKDGTKTTTIQRRRFKMF
jgi:hypothetical protein